MNVLPGSIYVYHVYAGDDRGWKKAVDPLGLESQMSVNCLMWY